MQSGHSVSVWTSDVGTHDICVCLGPCQAIVGELPLFRSRLPTSTSFLINDFF